MNVGWVGLGKLGLPCALVLDRVHDVKGTDVSQAPRKYLADPESIPYVEAGLAEEIEDRWPDIWVDTIDEVVSHADVVFCAVQTPHAPRFEGDTPMPDDRADFDYTYLTTACRQIAHAARRQAKTITLVVVSTVLPGTTERLLAPLARGVRLAYSPAFIAMGTAMADFADPEMVLVGGDPDARADVRAVHEAVHDSPIVEISIASAELAKVAYNCYSDDTEVLTDEGWRLFADLTGDERILSLNPETHAAEWVGHTPAPPNDSYRELIRFHSAKDDILVTPGHNMFAGSLRRGPGPLPVDGENYHYKFKLVAAEELESRATFSFTRSVRWIGEPVDDVVVVSRRVPADVYARFMGWYLAEGSVSQMGPGSWQIVVSQQEGGADYGTCRKAVSDFAEYFESNVSESRHGFTFYHPELGPWLTQFGHAVDKWVPEIIRESEPFIIREFLDAYLAGDGHDGDTRYYATTSDVMASHLSEMIVKVGRMPSFRKTRSRYGARRECWLIYETKSKTSTRRKVERVPYEGKVWCTTLDRNHIMLTRRNGRCTWQGNTYIGQKVVFANTMMELAHKTAADCDEVWHALSHATDRLHSPRYLRGGMGDGGGCHPRDNIAMSWLARRVGMSVDWFTQIMQAREAQSDWLAHLVAYHAEVSGLGVFVMGKAYKAGVGITVGSPATLLAGALDATCYDPIVDDFKWEPDQRAVYVIATNHPEFAEYRWPEGSIVVDPWGYIPDRVGVNVVRVGRKS